MRPRATAPDVPTVAISGGGIAAGCCAHLLGRAGLAPTWSGRDRTPVPVIVLSDAALALLRDVFGRADLFADRPRITRRIVAWGTGEPVALPHGAIILSETDLDTALGAPIGGGADAPMTIHTAPPFPAGEVLRFGSRRAVAAQVRLLHDADQVACWIEAVEEGWLFLVPAAAPAGWLLAVGSPLEVLLGQSRHISRRIELLEQPSSTFDTCPRLNTILQGPDWLACGSAAIGFDPICGDGTAQAVREAIMACAVIGAMREGGDSEALGLHFESMMVGAMRRHLRLCAQFYASGGDGRWWRDQLSGLAEGFDWCTGRLGTMPEPSYRLRDFRLVAREAAA